VAEVIADFVNCKVIAESTKEIDTDPATGLLSCPTPYIRHVALAKTPSEKPFMPLSTIFETDERTLSLEGLIKNNSEEAADVYTAVSSALEYTNSEANTGGMVTLFEKPIPILEESKTPNSTDLAAEGAMGATTPVIVQLTEPSKDA
jgi:hypothetical protein